MAGGGGREERNRGGRRRKRRPREEKVEEGLPAAEAVGKRRQRGPARKRERKVRRTLLEQQSRRGMADWKRLRLWLRRGDGGREEKEVAGFGEVCGSGRAAGSDEETREEGEEDAAGAAAEKGYGRLEAAAVVVEERRWWPERRGSEVWRGLRYEAWVIYNFLSLCLAWVGGPGAVVLSLSGRSLKPSWYLMTCCFPAIPLDGSGATKYRSRTFVPTGQEMDTVRKNKHAYAGKLDDIELSSVSTSSSSSPVISNTLQVQADLEAIKSSLLKESAAASAQPYDLSVLADTELSSYPTEVPAVGDSDKP
ncbi:hypothetical protein BHE74_00054930 [Ensete ventricosum]|nr:hypothetical protein BHE74_00054930 [Ensete ventricosum]